jgi:hypothetical protein
VKRWTWNVLVAFDKLWNAILNGYPDETISARAGTAQRQGKRRGCVLCQLLDMIHRGHCERAIADDMDRAEATVRDLNH